MSTPGADAEGEATHVTVPCGGGAARTEPRQDATDTHICDADAEGEATHVTMPCGGGAARTEPRQDVTSPRKTYAVKEVFRTLQGEGLQAGRAAVFLRFSRCNLWSGHERDRATAVCRFCDTDFVGTDGPGGGLFRGAADLARHVSEIWGDGRAHRFVVCTGGEPALQLDDALVSALHAEGFEVAVETNGTLPLPSGIDWVCVSPKAGTELVVTSGDELKVVWPQEGTDLHALEGLDFDHFLLSPMDGPDRAAAAMAAVEQCLARPRWRLSVQTHKVLGIP